MSKQTLEDIYTEGLFDRLGARFAGAKAGVGALGRNIKKGTKGLMSGTSEPGENVDDVKAQAKMEYIVNTFKNELTTLLGDQWKVKYADLATQLDNIAPASAPAPAPAPAPSPSTTLKKNAIVKGKGPTLRKIPYIVLDVGDGKTNIKVQPVNMASKKPYGAPTTVAIDQIQEQQITQTNDDEIVQEWYQWVIESSDQR